MRGDESDRGVVRGSNMICVMQRVMLTELHALAAGSCWLKQQAARGKDSILYAAVAVCRTVHCRFPLAHPGVTMRSPYVTCTTRKHQ